MARGIMDQLVDFGTVRRGLLGVNIAPLSPEIAEDYELDGTAGALVTAVSPGSAAERAGLEINDVIVSVNGMAVSDPAGLRNTIGLMRPGDEVEVGYVRDGSRRTVAAVLGELEAQVADAGGALGDVDERFEGAEVVTNDAQRPDYNGVPGVLVTAVEQGSPAAERGLRAGDVITHVNRQRIEGLGELREIVEDARSVVLQIQRGDRNLLLLMP